MQEKARILLLVAVLLAVTSTVAGAASPPVYSITWWSIASGGVAAGGDFSVSSSIGQVAAGHSAGGAYSLCAGFQCGVSREHRLFVPVIDKSY